MNVVNGTNDMHERRLPDNNEKQADWPNRQIGRRERREKGEKPERHESSENFELTETWYWPHSSSTYNKSGTYERIDLRTYIRTRWWWGGGGGI